VHSLPFVCVHCTVWSIRTGSLLLIVVPLS